MMEKQLKTRKRNICLAAYLLSSLEVFNEVQIQHQVGNEDYEICDELLPEFTDMVKSIETQLISFVDKLVG